MVLGYDYNIWNEYKIKSTIKVNLQSCPSWLITGSSGSGKSYATKWLLRNMLTDYNINLYFCNFKKSQDFSFLNDYEYYYTYTDCVNGLDTFYNHFKIAQSQNIEFNGTFNILCFDEYPAFILSASMNDKKTAEKYKSMISEILMLGRSYGFGIILIMQRPDSSLLANGARDNFFVTISLGNLSKEAKTMLYSGEELPKRIYQKGEGICWIDGKGISEIKFPKITDIKAVENLILEKLWSSDR